MVGLRYGTMVAVMAAMVLQAAGVRAEDNVCSTLKELNVCMTDQGPPVPGDGQTIYLYYPEYQGYWWYPKYNSRMSYWQHSVRTITETKDSWPKWIWHDCDNHYVCLESSRYPHYYLGAEYNTGRMAILYSDDPSHDERVRFTPDFGKSTAKGLETKFVLKKFESESNPVALKAHIYIPPRCEGYRQVGEVTNPTLRARTYKLPFDNGVVRSELTSGDKTVASDILDEVTRGIRTASLTGNFSETWANEMTKAVWEKDKHELTFSLLTGNHYSIWQKVAKYGMYEWRSGVLIQCEDIMRVNTNYETLIPVSM